MACFYLFLSLGGVIKAPARDFRGALLGFVGNPTGGCVPAAKIIVQSSESSFQREIVTDLRGEFRINDLLPGTYRVKVQASGFAEANSNVKITVSSVQEVIVTLKPQALQQSITLDLDGPGSITTQSIDSSSAVHQTIITRQDLQSIPLAARSFANIAYLAPGT